jgi:hypothetical protein
VNFSIQFRNEEETDILQDIPFTENEKMSKPQAKLKMITVFNIKGVIGIEKGT